MTTYTCDLDAGGWQLYTDRQGSAAVAADLSESLTSKVQAARIALKTNPLLSELKLAERIRDEMYEIMDRVATWGARDTEPECVLVFELEQAFGLDGYELER